MEKRRLDPAISCDGEPAPEREAPASLEAEDRPPGRPNGDRIAEPVPAESAGGVFAVGEPVPVWVEKPTGRCSDLVFRFDIMDYPYETLIEVLIAGSIIDCYRRVAERKEPVRSTVSSDVSVNNLVSGRLMTKRRLAVEIGVWR